MSAKDVVTMKETLERISRLERKVDSLEKRVNEHDVVDVSVQHEIANLKVEFTDMKQSIIQQLTTFTANLWKLIFILLFLIAALVGIKEFPILW